MTIERRVFKIFPLIYVLFFSGAFKVPRFYPIVKKPVSGGHLEYYFFGTILRVLEAGNLRKLYKRSCIPNFVEIIAYKMANKLKQTT